MPTLNATTHGALRLVEPIPVRFDRGRAGIVYQLAMDVQSRASKHGARRHHTYAEIDARRLTPLPATAKNGEITLVPGRTALRPTGAEVSHGQTPHEIAHQAIAAMP